MAKYNLGNITRDMATSVGGPRPRLKVHVTSRRGKMVGSFLLPVGPDSKVS